MHLFWLKADTFLKLDDDIASSLDLQRSDFQLPDDLFICGPVGFHTLLDTL